MNYPMTRFKNRSFAWAFVLFGILVAGPSLLTHRLDINEDLAAVMLGCAGSIPFLIQAITGYGLDSTWRATYSRAEHPVHFWLYMALSMAFAAMFWSIAIHRPG